MVLRGSWVVGGRSFRSPVGAVGGSVLDVVIELPF
jgi:hypothetical protein